MSEGRWTDDEDTDIESADFDPLDLVIVGLGLLAGVAGAVQHAANTTSIALKAFANHRRDNREAFTRTLKDIERL